MELMKYSRTDNLVKKQLTCMYELGMKYIVKDADGRVAAHNTFPVRLNIGRWGSYVAGGISKGYTLPKTLDLCNLVAWSDEPFDILACSIFAELSEELYRSERTFKDRLEDTVTSLRNLLRKQSK